MRVDTLGASRLPGFPERFAATAVAPATATSPRSKPALEVTIDGATQRFEAGSARNAIVGPLDSVEGLTTRITEDGRLQFVTDDARQVVIAEIASDQPGYADAVLDGLFITIDIV